MQIPAPSTSLPLILLLCLPLLAPAQPVVLFDDEAFAEGNQWIYRLQEQNEEGTEFERDEPAEIISAGQARGVAVINLERSFREFYRDTYQYHLAPEGVRELEQVFRDLDDGETETVNFFDDGGPGWLLIPRSADPSSPTLEIASGTALLNSSSGVITLQGTRTFFFSGPETINVPGGTYDTNRIVVTQELGIPGVVREVTETTLWLHPRLGIIRQDESIDRFEGSMRTGGSQLTRELISFRPRTEELVVH